MNKLLLVFFLFSQLATQAQEGLIPTNEKSGQAEIIEVVTVNAGTPAELNERAVEWIKSFYPNPHGVIKSNDSTSYEIKGKARFRLTWTDKKGNVTPSGFVVYSFTLQFKEGKFRYVIDRIHWKQASYFDISRWENKEEGQYDEEMWPLFIEQTMNYFNNMTDSLVEAVSTPIEEESTDW
ncbi:MAG: DUF4468 domain-containing protein [Bacteroidia bacterium]